MHHQFSVSVPGVSLWSSIASGSMPILVSLSYIKMDPATATLKDSYLHVQDRVIMDVNIGRVEAGLCAQLDCPLGNNGELERT
jgi:hypothetical protein